MRRNRIRMEPEELKAFAKDKDMYQFDYAQKGSFLLKKNKRVMLKEGNMIFPRIYLISKKVSAKMKPIGKNYEGKDKYSVFIGKNKEHFKDSENCWRVILNRSGRFYYVTNMGADAR